MRTLSLFRHAKSSWADLSLDDFDRPLTGRGKKAARAMGNFMASKNICPDLILCSPAKRTHQTLKRVLKELPRQPEIVFKQKLYLASPSQIVNLVRRADPAINHIMVIGHNPGLHALALLLLKLGPAEEAMSMTLKFPTAALATFSFDIENWQQIGEKTGHLDLYMIPKEL